MTKYYAPTSSAVSPSEKAHMEAVRKFAPECIVLFENDGVLPLKETGNIALYGAGVRRTVKGGTGSGDVNSRTVVNIEQGFEDAGFTVTTKAWLDAYDAYEAQAQKDYFDNLKKRSREEGLSDFALMLSFPYVQPSGAPITACEIANSHTDTAVYVIARNSGEGADRMMGRGDYMLTQDELNHIRTLAGAYEKFIVLLNVGGVIDTTELKAIEGVNAIMLVSQLGNIGGYAVADALCGKTMPSGKLTATWAADYKDYPSSEEFSHNNGDTEEGWYTEGIYVGYRYFDTFNVTPNYCFGFGRSYTEFSIETLGVRADEEKISVKVNVTNTGADYAGKEVVQIYVSAPAGKLEKPYQELAAFGKTDLLAPGESQIMDISFKTASMATYCEECASWVLEAGKYYIRVGNSSRNTHIAAAVEIKNTQTTEVLKNLFKDSEPLRQLSAAGHAPFTYEGETAEKENAPVISIEEDKISVKKAVYQEERQALAPVQTDQKLTMDDVLAGRASLDDLVSQLTAEEMTQLCIGTARSGGNQSIIGAASANVPGAAGDTTPLMLNDRNIRSLILADGPAGLRLTPEFVTTADGTMLNTGMVFGNMKTEGTDAIPQDAVHYYQYCTAIPIGTALAQSWNMDLIQTAGSIVGEEMEQFNVHLWLAPAMNIQRNPLCGRNFEYYSEDPLVAGMCAAADTLGVQSHKGVGTTIKHFAANSQEDDRYFTNAHISERAIREIYLKGFEIAVKTSQPMSIMSSYNLLNGVHTANSYELLTAVARDEWGFDGLVMTDWFTTQDVVYYLSPRSDYKYKPSSPALCIKAGNDLIMPGGESDVNGILAAVDAAEGDSISIADLQACAKNILRVLMRSSCYDGAKPYGEYFNLDWAVKAEKQ